MARRPGGRADEDAAFDTLRHPEAADGEEIADAFGRRPAVERAHVAIGRRLDAGVAKLEPLARSGSAGSIDRMTASDPVFFSSQSPNATI
jgi:hypothetical protein